MSGIIRSSLLLGVAVLSLAACSSDKGPGEIGSKDDIVVRNNGLPQAKQEAAAPAAAPQTGDFTSTVEQAEALPMPEVTPAEPLPDNSPAMKEAVQAQAEANAPLPSTATTETTSSTVPADTAVKPIDAVAPTTPVTDPAVIPPTPSAAPSATGNVYPSTDYGTPAATPAPAPAQGAPVPAPVTSSATPGPSAVPAGVNYPLDPNAPFSPKAVAAAAAAQGAAPVATPPPATPNGNPADPATIMAAQSALAAKGGYTGSTTGEIDAGFLNALIMYQAQNGLPQGGLNEATLKSLGVIQ